MEKNNYLSSQIITYLGNKRKLLHFIGDVINDVKVELKKEKLKIADLFSGSGVVSRYFTSIASELHSNDLESYCYTINRCYLTSEFEVDKKEISKIYNRLKKELEDEKLKEGFITKLYSPKNDENIKEGERVFFTRRNAKYIDTCRVLLEDVDEPYRTYFLATLLYQASKKNNTAGVFKGFYKNSETNIGQFGGNGKNALKRIKGDIEIKKPIFSKHNCKVEVYQEDANKLVKKLPKLDLIYLDPPYNQHPYSSNYFMLNLINDYIEPKEISKVSGIPSNWNKSNYNKKGFALSSLEDLVKNAHAEYVLISYNSEGFITYDQMIKMLEKYGKLQTYSINYNVYRGCRNLNNRTIHNSEYLFLLKKEDEI